MIVCGFVKDHASPVRAGEELDGTRLAGYLRRALPACGLTDADLAQPMQVAQFPGGHSNLTYVVRFGSTDLVIRRPPFGPVPPRAHDMAREYAWLAALHPIFPLAPKPYLLCDDPAVIGSVFYVMERRHGVVVRHDEPPSIGNREARRRVSGALVETLADLHAVDVRTADLAALGRPAGFVARQVRGWTERWHASQTTPLPAMDALAGWLHTHLPPDPERPSIVHGDFKLDNVMLDPRDAGRIVAVLDWEMSALGDPLVDVGILLAYWSPPAPAGPPDALTPVTDRPGYFTRDEIVEQYAARSGRDVSAMRFYDVFASFKIAVVIQQIFARYARGQTTDPRFAAFDRRVDLLARTAASLAERA
jgi:aminoglycoside phosphotransferase (APT) family kinase protein